MQSEHHPSRPLDGLCANLKTHVSHRSLGSNSTEHRAFVDGHDYGLAILLGALIDVKTVSMKLGSVSGRRVTSIHPSFFSVVSSLPKLEFLGVYLSPNIHLSPACKLEFLGLYLSPGTHHTMSELDHISSYKAHIYHTGFLDQYEHSWLPVRAYLIGSALATASGAPKFLATIKLLALAAVIEVTSDWAITIIHAMMALFHVLLYVVGMTRSSSGLLRANLYRLPECPFSFYNGCSYITFDRIKSYHA